MSSSDISIVALGPGDTDRIQQVCQLLVRSFRNLSPTWVPTLPEAKATVLDSFEPGTLSRVLLRDAHVLGWVGARHDYGSLWELHPLVVDETVRHQGYGRALVQDVERLVADYGALTLMLGTSDEVARTSLGGQDLFADPLAALRDIVASPEHPLGFWQKLGYTIVGVAPDAEGLGKPTIHLAKRVGARA